MKIQESNVFLLQVDCRMENVGAESLSFSSRAIN